jgi:spore maturation protein CgeB
LKSLKVFLYAPRFYGIDEAICEAFESVGIECYLKNSWNPISIQERIAREIGNKFHFTKQIFNQIIKYYLDRENEEFINCINKERPDILFIVRGDSIYPKTLMKYHKILPLVAYIWDDPFFSYAKKYNFGDDYRKSNFELGMFLYDYVFVYDTYYVDSLKKRGLENVEYLPLAADPKRYKKIQLTEEEKDSFNYDICFVGVPYPNRVEVLESLSYLRVGVFGDGWENYCLRRGKKIPSYYKGLAIGEKVLKLYGASKIVLNIHDPEAKEGLNTRTFDILACGAFEIVDHKKNLDVHFRNNSEIVSYNDLKELNDLVQFYLQNYELSRKIAEQGRLRVLAEHTWTNRIQKIVDTLSAKNIL